MKKVLWLVFFCLFFNVSAFAEIKILKQGRFLSESGNYEDYKTVCVDGLKFFIVSSSAGVPARSIGPTQIFEERDGKSLPARC